MNMKNIVCRFAAAVSGMMIFASAVGMGEPETPDTVYIEENQADTESDAQTDINENDTAEISVKSDWFKAGIENYDSSLSLVNYEIYEADVPDYRSDEEKAQAKTEAVKAFRRANPLSSMIRNLEMSDVDDYTTGAHVGEIPVSQPEPEINPQSGEFAFVTYGWGHGVGLSQNGANFYATYAGWSYQDILYHYYPGTYLMNTGMTDEEVLTIGGVPAGDTIDVIARIVNREIGGTMHYEAIKAQAVAIYTYLKYHDDDSADLLGKPDPPQIVYDACSEVLGEALFYNGEYALTMFSASSGGITANCYEVFYADLPYLRSVSSDYDAAYDPHYGTVTYYPASEVKRLVEAKWGITLSDDPGNWIQPIYSEQTGYVTDVVIDGQISVRGYDLKLTLDLKSPKFNVTYSY